MTVGNQLNSSQIDRKISLLAVQLRDVMQAISNLSMNVNGQGAGLAFLEAAGYTNTDAPVALAAISYLNTMAGVYFGTASQSSDYNFDQQLSQFWAGD
jgi:hypothetical protein